MSMIDMDDSESLRWLTAVILLNLKDLNSDSTQRPKSHQPWLTWLNQHTLWRSEGWHLVMTNSSRYSMQCYWSQLLHLSRPLRTHVMLHWIIIWDPFVQSIVFSS